MIFRFSRLLLLAACLATGTILPANAQKMRHGQPIFFSTEPVDTTSNNPTPSLLPRSPVLPTFGPAPGPNIDFPVVTPPPPRLMVPAISAAEAAQLKAAADKQNNWALMTPEEILGVPTPEKVLGVEAGRDRNETAVDRYYERQQRKENFRTNKPAMYGRERDDAATKPSPLFPDMINNNNQNEMPTSEPFSSGAPNSAGSRASADNSRMNTLFPSAFDTTATPSVRTPEQQRNADSQFQHLLTPNMPSALAQPVFENTAPARSQPQPNPFGSTYSPLNGGIGMPEGIKPLPGLIDQKNSATPLNTELPSPTRLPPWMSPVPQVGQRRDLRQ